MSEAGRLITSRQLLRELGRLGQRLGEGELGLEAARRQVALVVELARVGHPLVDQDQARPVLVEQLAQHVAGARRLLVVGLDAGERLLAAELPGQLAPQRAHHRAVGLGDGIAGRDLVAHQHHALAPSAASSTPASASTASTPASSLGRDAGEQVVERQHRVRLAAAEVGLELHHRVAALAREPLHARRRAGASGSRSGRCGGRTRPGRGTRPSPRPGAPARGRRRTRPAGSGRSPRRCAA